MGEGEWLGEVGEDDFSVDELDAVEDGAFALEDGAGGVDGEF